MSNPRRTGGSDRRTRSTETLARWAGAEVSVVRPVIRSIDHRVAGSTAKLAHGRIVPEAVVIDHERVGVELTRLQPDVVIFQTARTVHPDITGPWTTVVDFVDRLSVSYRQRSAIASPAQRPAWRWLAGRHDRFESIVTADPSIITMAAGRTCARGLGAHWVPILAQPVGTPTPDPSHRFDVVFFGTLGYPPNIEALRWLAEVVEHLPGLRVLVAGRQPAAEVVELCTAKRWHLIADFSSVADLAELAPVALAPLQSTAGMQIKLLDAAMAGMAQVVTSAALAGYDEAFPLNGADDPRDFARAIGRLLDDPAAARRQVELVQRHLLNHYAVQAVGPTFADVLGLRASTPTPSRPTSGPPLRIRHQWSSTAVGDDYPSR